MKFSKFKPSWKHLTALKHFAGRNNLGRITVRHQGGGHKQRYRLINWARIQNNSIVTNFEYDPNRSAFLAKLFHPNPIISNNTKKSFSYILAPKGLKIFDKLTCVPTRTKNLLLKTGDTSILANFEFGDLLHNIEHIPGQGGLYARAAGTFCQVLQTTSNTHLAVRLPSGSQKLLPLESKGTLGVIANEEHIHKNLQKAGRSRWLNKRPAVRGVAMNPVDHPHGGGQGKTKGGRPSVTPFSWPTKGQPTRNPRKNKALILTPRKKKQNKK